MQWRATSSEDSRQKKQLKTVYLYCFNEIKGPHFYPLEDDDLKYSNY